jgi:hypothetical protein
VGARTIAWLMGCVGVWKIEEGSCRRMSDGSRIGWIRETCYFVVSVLSH